MRPDSRKLLNMKWVTVAENRVPINKNLGFGENLAHESTNKEDVGDFSTKEKKTEINCITEEWKVSKISVFLSLLLVFSLFIVHLLRFGCVTVKKLWCFRDGATMNLTSTTVCDFRILHTHICTSLSIYIHIQHTYTQSHATAEQNNKLWNTTEFDVWFLMHNESVRWSASFCWVFYFVFENDCVQFVLVRVQVNEHLSQHIQNAIQFTHLRTGWIKLHLSFDYVYCLNMFTEHHLKRTLIHTLRQT